VEHSWIKIVIGMHRVARKLGHLWGRIPTWRVAELVNEAGTGYDATPIAEAIRRETNHLWPPEEIGIPGITGPEASGRALVQKLGSSSQIEVMASPFLIEMAYYNQDGYRRLVLWITGDGEWSGFGDDPRPRDYARLIRVVREAEWEPRGGIQPPEWVYGPEYDRYMALDLPLIFASPKWFEPGEVGPEEVEG